MSSNDFSHIITLREQALKYKERTERKLMTKMLKKGEYSPRTYIAKKHELEVWVNRERKEIRRTRKHFEECYAKTAEMIEQTQQNKEQLHRILLDSKGRREDFWSDAGSQKSWHSSSALNNNFSLNDSAGDRKGWASESLIDTLFEDERADLNAVVVAKPARRRSSEEQKGPFPAKAVLEYEPVARTAGFGPAAPREMTEEEFDEEIAKIKEDLFRKTLEEDEEVLPQGVEEARETLSFGGREDRVSPLFVRRPDEQTAWRSLPPEPELRLEDVRAEAARRPPSPEGEDGAMSVKSDAEIKALFLKYFQLFLIML